jgi:hypothetical protein
MFKIHNSDSDQIEDEEDEFKDTTRDMIPLDFARKMRTKLRTSSTNINYSSTDNTEKEEVNNMFGKVRYTKRSSRNNVLLPLSTIPSTQTLEPLP